MDTTTLELLGYPESFYTWRPAGRRRAFSRFGTVESAIFSAAGNHHHKAEVYRCDGASAVLVAHCWAPEGRV